MTPKRHTIVLLGTTFMLVCCTYASVADGNSSFTKPSEIGDRSDDVTVAKKLGKKKAYGAKSAPLLDEQNIFESLESHPGGFDFNLDDLEDIHENFKKGDLSGSEEELLKDANIVPTSTVPNLMSISMQGSNDSQHHVFKVTKNAKQKTKNLDVIKKDEFHKHSGLRYNSFDSPNVHVRNTSELVGVNGQHMFADLIRMFNHYNWEPSEIRSRVSTACGLEFYAYFSALNNNIEWAQRAFDSSGQYRGQFLYGNDLWLGERMFCEEVNHHINQTEREQFAFGFYMARISIKHAPSLKEPQVLNVGECLPKSCSVRDVQAILEMDPYSRLYQGSSSPDRIHMEVINVRKVPGDYVIWKDKAFYILCSICFIVLCITIAATIYEIRTESEIIVVEKKSKNTTRQDIENGKSFELFQMQASKNNSMNNNNNMNAEMEASNNQHESKNIEKTSRMNNNEVVMVGHRKVGVPGQILLCFSLRKNAKNILSNQNSNEPILSATHGMRVLSLFWTMLAHTYIFIFNVGENRYRRTITERSFAFQLIVNATFAVDTFFFISGLLVTNVFFKHGKKPTKPNSSPAKDGILETIMLVFYRYIRLTPAYLFVIVFNRIALEYILNDSVFTPSLIDYPACAKYWWRNILYINNWFPFQEFCLHWSWYLANDMQFYIMAVVLLIAARRYFKISVVVLLVFLCSSWATSGIVSLHFNYVFKVAKPFESFDILYDKPWQRIGTYIVGMITGYTIYYVKTPPRVPFAVNLSMWLCTIGIFFALVFGVWNGKLGLLATAFYVGIGHTAWGVALVWITLSCCWGLCLPLKKFLSYSGFLPLSRLTYCTYLIHPIIMSVVTYHMKGPLNLQHPIVLILFLGYTIFSYFAGLFVSLLFEAPMIRLSKIVLHK